MRTSGIKRSQYIFPGTSLSLILCAVLFGASCADHESGYYDGYSDTEARRWLVLGRVAYDEGYQQGHMQVFQDDWYAENADEIVVGPSCPVPAMLMNPVVFLEQTGPVQHN